MQDPNTGHYPLGYFWFRAETGERVRGAGRGTVIVLIPVTLEAAEVNETQATHSLS